MAEASVLLLITDSHPRLTIAHLPSCTRHLVARLQWRGPSQEAWHPVFINTVESGLQSVHYTWAGPEIIAVLRAFVPGAALVLLDHDTLFTARWFPRRFVVLEALPEAVALDSLGLMRVQEAQSGASTPASPASPWMCSPDRCVPSGARCPHVIAALCVTEDQLEATGGLVYIHGGKKVADHLAELAADSVRKDASL